MAIVTSTRYGKSMVLSLIALYRARFLNEKIGVIAGSSERAKIIYNHIIDNLQTCNPIIQEGLVGVGKVENLKTSLSKSGLSYSTGGSISTHSASQNRKTGLKGSGLIGLGFDTVLLDESAEIDDDNYSLVRRMALQSEKFKLIEISNPHQKNHFLQSLNDPMFTKIRINYKDAIEEGRMTLEQVEESKNSMTVNEFKVFVECEFVDGLNNKVFNLDTIKILNGYSQSPTYSMGIDIARSGDYTVIIGLDIQGDMTYCERLPHDSLVLQNEKIKNAIKSLKPQIVHVDQTGLGVGTFDELVYEFGHIIHGVQFNTAVKKEMVKNLQLLFEKKQVGIYDKDDLILNEILDYEVRKTQSGIETYGNTYGKHDDLVVGTMLAALSFQKSLQYNQGLGFIIT